MILGGKKEEKGTIKAYKTESSKKVWFSVHFIKFGKKAINSEEMLVDLARHLKKGKAKIRETHDVLYAKATKHRRRFGDVYWTFVICPKPEANIIFAFPKKHRKNAKDLISTIMLDD